MLSGAPISNPGYLFLETTTTVLKEDTKTKLRPRTDGRAFRLKLTAHTATKGAYRIRTGWQGTPAMKAPFRNCSKSVVPALVVPSGKTISCGNSFTR